MTNQYVKLKVMKVEDENTKYHAIIRNLMNKLSKFNYYTSHCAGCYTVICGDDIVKTNTTDLWSYCYGDCGEYFCNECTKSTNGDEHEYDDIICSKCFDNKK